MFRCVFKASYLMSRPPKSVPSTRKSAFDPRAFLLREARGNFVVSFPKDGVIFSQGDAADSLYYIVTGRVKVTVVSAQGKEAVIAILVPEELLGEGCLSGEPKRLSTASAMTDCEMLRVDKAEAQRLLREVTEFSEFMITQLLMRNTRIQEDLIDQLFNSTERRLARVLLLLANFGKDGRPEQIVAKISQEILAEMIGTTRSRVNHFMNKFRRLGFIEYNGSLKVNSSLLSVVLNEPTNRSVTEPE